MKFGYVALNIVMVEGHKNAFQNLRTVCGHLQNHQNHIFAHKNPALYSNALIRSDNER